MPVTNTSPAEKPAVQQLLRSFNNPWKMRLYYWQKIPSLLFWGVKIEHCTPERAMVSVPFRWRTQNPFRSTYFAALCGAAELSTGVLAFVALQGHSRVSMLITHIEADFVKKANGRTVFTCEEGDKIQRAVQQAIDTQTAQTVRVTTIGRNAAAEVVAQATLTWSFKLKA
ncbi:MAG TPA: DUF4442 domain-containing protein [Saprospiraceae bacterium]|nr:DUF4442 domain-containing protein [Saprospiraceae bacterium]HMP25871.1 DUF4442 domain-containing protein [Saprospiraceae bacterium]